MPDLVIVGGFLGAGKTTLILAAAKELARRGLRSAAVLNDQSDGLVDTALVREQGMAAGEVTHGCFCCRFSDFLNATEQLRAHSPDVIFAEPVGSCTDIAATVIRPLREYGGYRLAPFTVAVDPGQPHTDPSVDFLYRNQLAEADLIVHTKADLYPGPFPRQVSAKTGAGVAAWLDEVLSGVLSVAGKTLDIDYEEYASAEAALAWLNLHVTLEPRTPLSPAMLLGPLLDDIAARVSVVHLKATDQSTSGFLKAAISSGGAACAEGALDASPAKRHEILLNLRALSTPEEAQAAVEQALQSLDARQTGYRVTCFRPAAPKPERRVS